MNCQLESLYSSDHQLNLDNLLLQLRSRVATKWYQFGQAAGVPKQVLEKCMGYPADQCIVEVFDYWLRNQKDNKLTWKDVANILNEIGENDLGKEMISVYTTGK